MLLMIFENHRRLLVESLTLKDTYIMDILKDAGDLLYEASAFKAYLKHIMICLCNTIISKSVKAINVKLLELD